ncbi:MAG: EamA family transporter [Candidatus Fermentibacteraceae bacterium]
MVFLYIGLKHGSLSSVMTIAFCLAPVVSAVLGYLVLPERLASLQLRGTVMCVGGAALVSRFRTG